MLGIVDSSPAVSDGRVYVGTHGSGGRIYCFGDPGDIVPPRPLTYSPTGTGVPTDVNFVVEWSEEMNWTSVETSFSFTDGMTVWDYSWGTFTHEPLTDTTTFDPFIVLSPSTTYWVTFDSSAVDTSGNPLDGNGDGTGGDDLTWSFTTMSGDTPPLMDLLQPGSTPGQSFNAGSVVSIQWVASDDNAWPSFGNVVNMSYGPTVSGGTSIVTNEFEDGIYAWDTAAVIPGNYYVNISVYDSIGQMGWDNSDFSFTILPPSLPPGASILQPAGGEMYSGGATIDIIWTMGDDNTPDQNLIVYLNYSGSSGQGPIAGPLTGLSSPFIYPWTLPLIDDPDVVVEIDVIDEDGLVGSHVSGIFAIDSTPPIVNSNLPVDGESNVATNANIIVFWSEAMNTTATEGAFLLSDNATWTPVSGFFSWSPNGTVMTFDPDSDLQPNNWYTANFSTSAKDESYPGNTMLSAYSWSFRTTTVPDSTPPGISKVQTIPLPGEVYLPVNISAVIADAYGIAGAFVEIDPPLGPVGNFSMSYDSVNARYYLDRSYDELGSYFCIISAQDNNGLWNSSACSLSIEDTTRPVISGVTRYPNPQEVYFSVNVSAVVSDNFQIQQVRIDLVDPFGGAGNFMMFYDSVNGQYYYTQSYDLLGSYTCGIRAYDTSNNQDYASCNFDIVDTTPPELSDLVQPSSQEVHLSVNVSAIAIDNYQLEDVSFEVHNPLGASIGNFTMSLYLTTDRYYYVRNYSVVGAYTFTIWASDSSNNWDSLSGQFEIVDTTPPQITHTPPSDTRVRTQIPIQASVVDNHQMNSSWVNYTDTSGYHFNASMTHLGEDAYELPLPSQNQIGQITYFIFAVDQTGNGAVTAIHTINIYDPAPRPPSNLGAETSSDGKNIILTWEAPATNTDGSPVDDLSGYYIYRSGSQNPPDAPLNPDDPVGVLTYTDTNVEPGKTYYYWATAVDQADNESGFSAIASASTGSDDFLLIGVALISIFAVLLIALLLILLKRRKKKPSDIPIDAESIEEGVEEQKEE
ncbi:MAG: Ig-like domain-containing protein [Methanobacteriota archaeon]|nr:MAG: Ig-like domain-containing protein [Euryarchaeota archaeon]